MRNALLALFLLVLAIPARAADETANQAVTAALSAETRAVLIREMQAIAEAMGRIHRAVVTGDHAMVAKEAGRIHDSFVLAQELSEAQRREIREGLPAGFIRADRAFHGLAARLAEAGKGGDPRLERLWFQEMTRACQACHAEYAAGRFPGLADSSAGNHD